MCEIQIIAKFKDNINKTDINNFSKLMEFGVVNGNKDAWGVFNGNYSFKEKGIFNPKHLDKKMLLSDGFVVGHNRWKTSGAEDKNFNNHPFEMGDFVLVHNGVIHNDDLIKEDFKVKHKIETDSFVILWLVNNFFNKSKNKIRSEKIVESIEKTFEHLEGSLSVVIYDRVEKNIYYFKNDKTSFYIQLIGEDILIGSTNHLNLEYIYTDDKKEDFDLKDNCIYMINQKGISLCKKIKKKEKIYEFGGYGRGLGYYDEDYERLVENIDWEIQQVFYNTIGYIPDFKISGNQILIQKDSIGKNTLEYMIDKVKERENFFKINLEDFLEMNSIWQ